MPFLFGLVVAIAISAGVLVAQDNEPNPGNTPSAFLENNNTVLVANANAQPSQPHELSIPALFDYMPTGRDLQLGAVQDDNNSYTRYTISYRSDDLRISGILNIPKGTGPFPVLFLNHGYIDPSEYTNGRGLRREQDYFARHGFAVLHSDYRCHAQSDCPGGNRVTQRLGYVRDVINAVAAVKYSGDSRLSTTSFGMLGHSMGGGITQRLVVSQPELIDAAVLYAPVSMDEAASFERYTSRRPEEARAVIDAYGAPSSNPDFWNNLSAKTFLDRITVPLLFFQGTADTSVEKSWTDESVQMLKAAKKNVDYVIYDGQPHEFTTQWEDFMRRSVDFFRQNLKP